MKQIPYNGVVVAIVGPIASGKTTMAEFLRDQYNFIYFRTSLILRELMEAENLDINEKAIQDFGQKFSEKFGGTRLIDIMLDKYNPNANHVYDGLRYINSYNHIKKRVGKLFMLIYLDTPDELRYQRFTGRLDGEREASYSAFINRINHPVEKEVPLFKEKADLIIENIDLVETQRIIIEELNNSLTKKDFPL